MKKKELTAADVWTTLAETKQILKEAAAMQKETVREMKETDRRFKETVREMKETDRRFKETDRKFKETDWKFKETDRKFNALREEIGGIGHSNGEFAEEFFYNSLEKTMTFAGMRFDVISNKFASKKIMPDKTEIAAQFDIVLHNGNSIALIEAKYKANLKDLKELVEKKVPNFRLLYPEYAKYKLYLGIGSLVLKERILQEAKKLGIGLMKQRGDAVEHKTDWVRAY